MIKSANDDKSEKIKQKSRFKTHKRKILALIVIMIILIPLIFYWYYSIRPITVDELQNRDFRSGESVELVGTITEIETHNTTYGQLTLITLDDDDEASYMYQLIVENGDRHKIGDEYKTKLHFEEYNNYTIHIRCQYT